MVPATPATAAVCFFQHAGTALSICQGAYILSLGTASCFFGRPVQLVPALHHSVCSVVPCALRCTDNPLEWCMWVLQAGAGAGAAGGGSCQAARRWWVQLMAGGHCGSLL
jgi:hypothetical protein